MQAEANDLVTVEKEPEHIRRMYGLDNPVTEPFGPQCPYQQGATDAELVQVEHDGPGVVDVNTSGPDPRNL